MKILFKTVFLFMAGLSAGMVFVSCNKPDTIMSPREGEIYMPAAAASSNISLILADTAQTIAFGAAYGGLQYPGQDISVDFKIDSTLVSSYNAQHGTSYVMLPASGYQVPSLSAVIKAGETSSAVLAISVFTASLDKAIKYIIPVSISHVSAGFADSALSTTYFRIDTIQRLEKDITNEATLTVSRENGGGMGAGEGSPKLVDGDYNTKFLTDGFPQSFWMKLTFPAARVIGAYTITSGNDAPDRDMKDWNLEGSNDGSSWTILDARTSQSFATRNMTVRYEFDNTTAYTQYRINVLSNNGSNLIQISEWRLITYP